MEGGHHVSFDSGARIKCTEQQHLMAWQGEAERKGRCKRTPKGHIKTKQRSKTTTLKGSGKIQRSGICASGTRRRELHDNINLHRSDGYSTDIHSCLSTSPSLLISSCLQSLCEQTLVPALQPPPLTRLLGPTALSQRVYYYGAECNAIKMVCVLILALSWSCRVWNTPTTLQPAERRPDRAWPQTAAR